MNNSVGDESHHLFHCIDGDLLDIKMNFMNEFYKDNKVTDMGPLNTKNIIIKLPKGEYKIDHVNLGNFLASASELLRQSEVDQPG